jgi:hypothetical protein
MQRLALAVSIGSALTCTLTSGCRLRTVLDEPLTTVNIARLQSYEGTVGTPIPPEISRWLASGASGLPADVLPFGIVPTGTPLPHYDATTPAIDAFHVNDFRAVEPALAHDLTMWAKTAGGGQEHATCMYPEFGLDVWHGQEHATVLVSISCGKMQVIENGSRNEENLTMASVKNFVSLVKRAYNENIVHEQHVDESQITQERSTP